MFIWLPNLLIELKLLKFYRILVSGGFKENRRTKQKRSVYFQVSVDIYLITNEMCTKCPHSGIHFLTQGEWMI